MNWKAVLVINLAAIIGSVLYFGLQLLTKNNPVVGVVVAIVLIEGFILLVAKAL